MKPKLTKDDQTSTKHTKKTKRSFVASVPNVRFVPFVVKRDPPAPAHSQEAR